LNFQTWLMRVELLSIFKYFLGGDTDMVAKKAFVVELFA